VSLLAAAAVTLQISAPHWTVLAPLAGLFAAAGLALLASIGLIARARVCAGPLAREVAPAAPALRRETLDLHRLEARRKIERHISEKLDLEELLVIIATSARRLIGGAFSIVYLREGDVLYPRAWAELPDWIRDIRVPVGAGVTGTAVASGQGIIANDYANSPLALPPFNNAALRLLAQPLLTAGRAVGAMMVSRADIDAPFTAEDLSTLADLATQAAVAIENARLFAEAKRSAAEYQALFEVAGLVASTLDLDRLLDLVVDRCRGLMGVASAAISRFDADAGVLIHERGVGLSPEFVSALRVRLGEGTSGRAARDRTPAWTADILEDPAISLTHATRDLVLREGYRAVLSVPLLIKGELYGVLAVYWWEPHAPSLSEVALLSALAGQSAIAIENARLYAGAATHAAALDVRATRLRTLARLTSTVSSSLDTNAVLQAIVTAAAEIMGAPFVSVYVANESSATLELRAVSDERIGASLPPQRRYFGQGLVGWIAEHRRLLEVPDVLVDERSSAREWARTHGLRGFLGVPIVFQDSLLGVLTLNCRALADLGANDASLLDSFVSQAAVAIRNTRLYAEQTRHLEETRAMLEVAEILNSTLDPQRVLKRVAIKIAQVCCVDRCSIERWEGDRVIPLMSQFADGRKDDRMWTAFVELPNPRPRDVPAHAQAIETRRPVIIPDTLTTDLIPREWVDTFGSKSYLVVPLIRQDAVIGVMTLDNVDHARPLERGQVDLAMAIAGQLALTLDNTRLYGEAQERLRERTTLLAVAQVLSQPGPSGEVMRRTAREIGRAFGADMVGIYVVDERRDALVPLAGYHVPKHLLALFTERPFVLSRFPILEQAWRAGRPFWSTDVKNDPRIDRETFDGVDPHSVLLAPTMVHGEALGALFMVWWGTGREFTPEEIRLTQGVASHVGLAMENAELSRQTQQKLAETERLVESLSVLSEERARAHSELAAAQDQLVRTEKLRAMGEMASGVAHDFNNVLASILGRAQLLLRRVEEPKLRQWLEVIERSALDGARTVRRLQDFTRIRRDHPVVPVNLNQVVQQTLEATESSWRQESQRRGIRTEVVTALTPTLPEVPGDPAELREALTNLILNALDAMPAGGTLALSTSAAAGQVEIAVADTGIGIPANIRHKIFDPFFTTKGPKGTGLGLSMTYGILARHGARISVESEEGRGTKFRLAFPVTDEAMDAVQTAPAPHAPARSLNCLVVDDEEVVAAVLGDMLTSEGHKVEIADGGQQALTRFSAGAFDLVLTDLAMPGMTGWEVARAIKNMASAVRVVLVSGFGVEVPPEDLQAHGVDLVLPKPLKLQDIASAVALVTPGER
jgi:GAF domain-containing protein/CheY-like chemotaxis protein